MDRDLTVHTRESAPLAGDPFCTDIGPQPGAFKWFRGMVLGSVRRRPCCPGRSLRPRWVHSPMQAPG